MSGQKHVHVSRIHPHPDNVREELGDLTETAASIRAHGILQPLLVEPHPAIDGAYPVLAGHRRLAAAQLAGRDPLPLGIRRSPAGTAPEELMLVENCQRRDLGPMEKAAAMGALRGKGYTAARIARSVGLTDSTVRFYLTLLALDTTSQDKIRTGNLSAADAVAGVRRVRKRARRKNGAAPAGPVWEPDHFTASHQLARKARALCDAREHTMRRRIGKVACGQCWETTIRQDEQIAAVTLRSVS